MTAVGKTASRPAPGRHGADAHLPWWAVVLPVIGFLALLLLIMGSGQAEAAERRAAATGDDKGVTRVLKHFEQALPG